MAAAHETTEQDTAGPRPRPCPDCGGEAVSVLARLSAGRIVANAGRSYVGDSLARLGLQVEDEFPIARCDACGFVHASVVLADDQLRVLYEEVIDGARDQVCEREPLRVRSYVGMWCCLLEGHPMEPAPGEDLRVLDFGAGYGTFLQVARAPGYTPFAFEPSGVRSGHLRRLGIRAVESLAELRESAPFHFILCNQVLEHVADPGAVVSLFKDLLHPQGRLYLSVPHYDEERLQENLALYASGGDYPPDLNPWEHLNYFSPATFSRQLVRHGLTVRRWPLNDPSVAYK
jgi:SAM-dependent methyltransferase